MIFKKFLIQSKQYLNFFVDEMINCFFSVITRLLLLKRFSREVTNFSSARCKRSLINNAFIFLIYIDDDNCICCSKDKDYC